jgi:hypothetical protein
MWLDVEMFVISYFSITRSTPKNGTARPMMLS